MEREGAGQASEARVGREKKKKKSEGMRVGQERVEREREWNERGEGESGMSREMEVRVGQEKKREGGKNGANNGVRLG